MWDAWQAGDRKGALAAIPDSLVDELIVLLSGTCMMLGDGPTLGAHDSMVLAAGHAYGFTAGDGGMAWPVLTSLSRPFCHSARSLGSNLASCR